MSQEVLRVAESLRRLRLERGLSLTQVADRAEISVATLSRVETNKQTLDIPLLFVLAKVLGVGPSEILVADGDAKLKPAARARLVISASRQGGSKELNWTIDNLVKMVEALHQELVGIQKSLRKLKR